jgi:hypothetical protein
MAAKKIKVKHGNLTVLQIANPVAKKQLPNGFPVQNIVIYALGN